MEWTVQLIGDPLDLAALAQSLTTSETKVFREGQNHVLASDAFAHAADAAAVRRTADEILALINGAARLALGALRPIQIGAIYRKRSGAPPEIHVMAEPVIVHLRSSASVWVVDAGGTIQESHPADPVRDWLALGRSDAAVGKVLQSVAAGTMDWVNLYRMLEIVSEDAGGLDTIISNGWATKRSLRLFKHTANSPGAVGLDARHGAETTDAPAAPMPISEARSLITSTVHAWLRAKTDARASQTLRSPNQSE